MDVADHHQIDDVPQGQGQARNDGGKEDLAHGDLGIGAHGNQHDGGRNQNAQGAAGAHHAAGQRRLIAAAQQDGQGQHAHGHHGRAHDAGGGGEHGGNQDDRQTQAALQGAQQVADGLEQAVRHLGVGQEVCHEHEHGDGDHGIALHLVVYLCHGNGYAGIAHGDGAHDDARAAQNEGQLLAQDQADHHQAEEDQNQDNLDVVVPGNGQDQIGQHLNHFWSSFPPSGRAFLPCTSSMRHTSCFSISETVCTARRNRPMKKQSLTGQVGAAHTE